MEAERVRAIGGGRRRRWRADSRLPDRGGGAAARAARGRRASTRSFSSARPPPTSASADRRSSGGGFLYVISRLGVTGMRDKLADDVRRLMQRVRAVRICRSRSGFGISSPEHVAEACRVADAAVVGSALVNVWRQHGAAADGCERAERVCTVAEEAACERARRAPQEDRRAGRGARPAAQRARGVRARDRPVQEADRAGDLPAVARGPGAGARAEHQSRARSTTGNAAAVRAHHRRSASPGANRGWRHGRRIDDRRVTRLSRRQ